MSSRKRSRGEFEEEQATSGGFGLGDTLSRMRGEEAGHSPEDRTKPPTQVEYDDGDGWQIVSKHSRKRSNKRSKKKHEKDEKSKYPSITHSPQARLQTKVKLGDVQALALYLLADGPAPQWVAIRHQAQLKKVVVLMVPGLELAMFDGSLSIEESTGIPGTGKDSVQDGRDRYGSNGKSKPTSPDDYYPRALNAEYLQEPLRPLARIFPHVWPVYAAGDPKFSRIWSPLTGMLSVPLPKSKEEKQQKGIKPAREAKTWQDQSTPAPMYLATADQLLDNDYVVHDSLLTCDEEVKVQHHKRASNGQTSDGRWVETTTQPVDGTSEQQNAEPSSKADTNGEHAQASDSSLKSDSLTGGRDILAIDCEMCQTGEDRFELTRISIVDWSGAVVLDTLVKPPNPITNYLTPYSGITPAKLDPVTTTLPDVQSRLLALLKPDTILLGHSLNSDLAALKLIHPHILDTSILYPHPGGDHLKSSLKWLTSKYLSRDIQKGANGHDSIEDARAALDLVKIKCQRGPKWGTSEATVESIFKRVGRTQRPGAPDGQMRTGAVVDWGVPNRGHGAAADVCIGCTSDEEVVDGTIRATNGDEDGMEVPGGGVDFVWARMRGLEAVREWWGSSKTADNDALRDKAKAGNTSLSEAVRETVAGIERVYEGLPACTAFVVYTGTGDPIELRRLQEVQSQFKKEYQVKKWDQLSVKWTDTEEQALKRAFNVAREGCGFITVK